MNESSPPPPTDDERRAAACRAMAAAPGLIRFAARYTRSLHDAEDAYQRTMEIALTRAPVTEPRRFMAWLHTVLRNEALAVAGARRREGPSAEADVTEVYEDQLEDAVAVDALAEWRERYRSIQDGLAGLTEAQRICLILQTAGASYERIHDITGFSLRKVERSVLEGRKGLAAWEVRLMSGEACERLDTVIARVALGEASSKDRRAVSRHVRHCGHCRALLRRRRESNEWLAGLVPLALLASGALSGGADPTPAIAWWDRVADGATVRMGNAVQMAMDLPATAIAKVGAGTAAAVVAGAAGLPVLAEAVWPGPPPAAVQEQSAALPTGTTTSRATSTADVAPFSTARRAVTDALERTRVARVAARRKTTHTKDTPAVTATATHSTSAATSAAPARSVSAQVVSRPAAVVAHTPAPSAVALDFGP